MTLRASASSSDSVPGRFSSFDGVTSTSYCRPFVCPANVRRVTCGEPPRAGGSSGGPLAAAKRASRAVRSASGLTPCVLGRRRRFSAGRGERAADRCTQELGGDS